MPFRCGEQIGPIYSGAGTSYTRRWSEYTGGAEYDHKRYMEKTFSLGTLPLDVPEDFSDFAPLPSPFYYRFHTVVPVMRLERTKTGTAMWEDETPTAGRDDVFVNNYLGLYIAKNTVSAFIRTSWPGKVWAPYARNALTESHWTGATVVLIPFPDRTSRSGAEPEVTDDGAIIVGGLDASDSAGSSTTNGYFGSNNGWLPPILETPDVSAGFGIPHDGAWGEATWTITFRLEVYTWAEVWHPDEYIEYPPTTGTGSPFGLALDVHPFGPLRMVYNAGFNTAALVLRRHYGLDGTPSDVALPFSGQSPSILCRADGTHLIATSDGTNIQLRRVSDEGEVLQTMPSPGPGKLCSVWESKFDFISPVWVAYCTADTGTGDVKVYRTLDAVGLTGWEAAITVASGVPAQKPGITGDCSRLVVTIHDGANIKLYVSTDNGATWGLSS